MLIKKEDREKLNTVDDEANAHLRTDFPLGERDEVAAASERTRRLYEKLKDQKRGVNEKEK